MLSDVIRCYPMLSDVIRCYPMLSDVIRCYPMLSDVIRCSAMFDDVQRCSTMFGDVRRMFGDVRRCSAILSDVQRYCPMFSDIIRASIHDRDILQQGPLRQARPLIEFYLFHCDCTLHQDTNVGRCTSTLWLGKWEVGEVDTARRDEGAVGNSCGWLPYGRRAAA